VDYAIRALQGFEEKIFGDVERKKLVAFNFSFKVRAISKWGVIPL
jgi:hypothetical protein